MTSSNPDFQVKQQRDTQPRLIVLQLQFRPMQISNRFYQAQAQSVARGAAVRCQPYKTLEYFFTLAGSDARAVVTDSHCKVASLHGSLQADSAVLGCVLESVVE